MARCNLARPTHDHRYPQTAFRLHAFLTAERSDAVEYPLATLYAAVVGAKEHDGFFIEAELLQQGHQPPQVAI